VLFRSKRLEPHKRVKFKEWRNAEETKALVGVTMDKYKKMVALYKG
jgi:inorganic pyrophosphatase